MALGITGRATNLADGTVEVIMCGPKAKLDMLCQWLEQGGPATARVEKLRCETWAGAATFNGFESA